MLCSFKKLGDCQSPKKKDCDS